MNQCVLLPGFEMRINSCDLALCCIFCGKHVVDAFLYSVREAKMFLLAHAASEVMLDIYICILVAPGALLGGF